MRLPLAVALTTECLRPVTEFFAGLRRIPFSRPATSHGLAPLAWSTKLRFASACRHPSHAHGGKQKSSKSAQLSAPAIRTVLVCLLFSLAACDAAPGTAPPTGDFRPMRIVSLDYCADQYVLQLVEPERILALSRDAEKDFSYLRELAAGLPTVRPVAEDVLVLGPDLVIRSYGGGPNAAAFYARAGVAVLNVGNANTIDEVLSVMADVASGLGESTRGQAVIEATRQRLTALPETAMDTRTLYMTPAGVTTGPGSLVHEMLLAAGLQNYQQVPGWRPIPLELLAHKAPELVAFASFGASAGHRDAWSAMRHPLARNQLADREVVPLQGAWTACGGWFLLDAVEALARGAPQ